VHTLQPFKKCNNYLDNMTKILDCTIRDGGYINNWNFTDTQVINLYKTLKESKIDYMEIGFKDNIQKYNNRYVSKWKILREEIIDKTIKDIYDESTKLCVMVNYGSSSLTDFVKKEDSLISMVRIAFHKKDYEKGIEYGSEIKKMGYDVCCNVMGIINYSDDELNDVVKLIIKHKIDYLYIADSYGSLSNIYLKGLILKVRKFFMNNDDNYKYKLGYHAHNNTQRALLNATLCLEMGIDIIDTTMYGMGRGAGNLCTEVFVSELIQSGYNKYNNDDILRMVKYIYNDLIYKIGYPSYTWGYDILYFLSGHLNIHPNYVTKIKEYEIYDIDIIILLLNKVKTNKKNTMFDVQYFDHILCYFQINNKL
jgi:4-hydroxy 2-oxovalerate aldolase